MKPFLFVTDIDNTLIGDDFALNLLNQELAQHRQQDKIKIVYTTERSLSSYKILAQAKSLLRPDALLTSLGTEIYGDFVTEQPDKQWSETLSLGWNRDKIVGIANQFPTLQTQPKSEQNPFKISYYLAQTVAKKTIADLDAVLKAAGFNLKFIYSGGQDLDLLPQKLNKGFAVRLLRTRWQIDSDKTVTCGDCEGDIALFQNKTKGIIVGNATSELLDWYWENKRPSLYLAKANYAYGVLEGLEYFGFLDPKYF